MIQPWQIASMRRTYLESGTFAPKSTAPEWDTLKQPILPANTLPADPLAALESAREFAYTALTTSRTPTVDSLGYGPWDKHSSRYASVVFRMDTALGVAKSDAFDPASRARASEYLREALTDNPAAHHMVNWVEAMDHVIGELDGPQDETVARTLETILQRTRESIQGIPGRREANGNWITGVSAQYFGDHRAQDRRDVLDRIESALEARNTQRQAEDRHDVHENIMDVTPLDPDTSSIIRDMWDWDHRMYDTQTRTKIDDVEWF